MVDQVTSWKKNGVEPKLWCDRKRAVPPTGRESHQEIGGFSNNRGGEDAKVNQDVGDNIEMEVGDSLAERGGGGDFLRGTEHDKN